jgi:hypothetical protein
VRAKPAYLVRCFRAVDTLPMGLRAHPGHYLNLPSGDRKPRWRDWKQPDHMRIIGRDTPVTAMQTLDPPTANNLLHRLQRLQPESHALWGKMNAHQMVCHLNDSFGFAMGAKPTSEDVTFLNRTLIRWVALHTNLPWPQGVPTRPEMDQFAGGTSPVDFALDKAALAAAIEQFAAQPRAFQFPRHPIFGELTEWEWMRWGYLHPDHHFRQFGV